MQSPASARRPFTYVCIFTAILALAGSGSQAGLVAHYKLDEDSGLTVHDSSGNAYDGTISGDASWVKGWISETPGFGALQLSGGIVEFGPEPGSSEALTVSLWTRTGDRLAETLLNKYPPDGVYTGVGWDLVFRGAGQELNFYTGKRTWVGENPATDSIYTTRTGTKHSTLSPYDFSNQWMHIACTYDSGVSRIFLNGKEAPGSPVTGLGWVLDNSTIPLRLGGSVSSSEEVRDLFFGEVDDICIYDSALSSAEIAYLASPLPYQGDLIISGYRVLSHHNKRPIDTYSSSDGDPQIYTGLDLNSDGILYVNCRATDRVLRYVANTQPFLFLEEFVSAGSGGMNDPQGLVIGPDDNLYVASAGTDSILRFEGNTGSFTDAFVPANSGGLDNPQGLVFGPDNHLYVACAGTNSILRFSGTTGAFIDDFVPAHSGGLDNPQGLVFGPDNNLYVASAGTDSVLRFDGTTGTPIGDGLFVPPNSGGLDHPRGLAFGPDEAAPPELGTPDLYVSSENTGTVIQYDGVTGAPKGGLYVNSPQFLIFGNAPKRLLGARISNPAAAGLSILVSDRKMFDNYITDQSSAWEPYTCAFGDGTLALGTNTEASDDAGQTTERGVAAFFNTDGTVVESDGFFTEAGDPWTTNNDIARITGNPPRIAGDKRLPSEGGTNQYLFGNECTPWAFPGLFASFGSGFDYNLQVACVQILAKTAGGAAFLGSPLIDPIYGNATEGGQPTPGLHESLGTTRFGGEIRALSNGNFVVVVHDRLVPQGNAANTTIVDAQSGSPTFGQVIVGPFNANPIDPNRSTGIWSNVAAFDGGFAVRPANGATSANGYNTIGFWDNDGNLLGTWEAIVRSNPSDPLAPADGNTTSVTNWGGSATSIDSDIRSNFIYLAGPGTDAEGYQEGVYVTKIDAQTFQTVKEAYVSDTIKTHVQRVEVCSDLADNVFVCWSDAGSNNGLYQIIGRLYDSNLNPVTEPFLCFANSEIGPESSNGFNLIHPSCAMTDTRILVTGRAGAPSAALDIEDNQPMAIVFENPLHPLAEIVAPSPGVALSGPAVLVEARLAQGQSQYVQDIEFQADTGSGWTTLGSDSVAPYMVNWDTTLESEGAVELRAVLHNVDSSLITSSVVEVAIDHTNPDVTSYTNPEGNPEARQVVTDGQDTEVTVGDPTENTSVTVEFPTGAVGAETTATVEMVSLENVPDAIVAVRIELDNEQTTLNQPVTITIAYPDMDQDGFVDGTDIPEENLAVAYINSLGELEFLGSRMVDTVKNLASGTTDHLSTFVLTVLDHPTICYLPPDVNKDGLVNVLDLRTVARSQNRSPGDRFYDPRADVNLDGEIDNLDVTAVAHSFGEVCGSSAKSVNWPQGTAKSSLPRAVVRPTLADDGTWAAGELVVDIVVDDVVDMTGYQLELYYDPGQLSVLNWSHGTVFSSMAGEYDTYTLDVDVSNPGAVGQIVSTWSEPQGVSGTAPLFTVSLEVVGEGAIEIGLGGVIVAGEDTTAVESSKTTLAALAASKDPVFEIPVQVQSLVLGPSNSASDEVRRIDARDLLILIDTEKTRKNPDSTMGLFGFSRRWMDLVED